jgi:hypothetical protein
VARVSIFAESAKQASIPLGYNAFLQWPKIVLQPRETRTIFISRNAIIHINK